MIMDYEGRVALVTGAGSGIGRAIASLLAERGAQVVVNDADPDLAARAASDLGPSAIADATPVGAPEAARVSVRAALKAFGRLDILINNAGVVAPGGFDAHDDAEILRVMTVNLGGPYALCRAAWPAMRAQGYGRIVNLCSSAALGSGNSGPYAVSKAGLIGLTREAAVAGAPFGILANAVMPSAYTALLDRHPDPAFRAWMKANLKPEAVAPVIAYLASEGCGLSGDILTAGGGRFSRIALVESQGVVDGDLTPEQVEVRLAEAIDLEQAVCLRDQADHQSAYRRVFPS